MRGPACQLADHLDIINLAARYCCNVARLSHKPLTLVHHYVVETPQVGDRLARMRPVAPFWPNSSPIITGILPDLCNSLSPNQQARAAALLRA